MHALLDVLIFLIRHSFWEPVFSQFVEPKFWPKKTEMVLRHCYREKNRYYWDSIRKYEYEAWNALWTKNLEQQQWNKLDDQSRDLNKKRTYFFSIHFKVFGSLVAILVKVVKILYHFKFKFFSTRTSSIYFSVILCEFYLIIVYNLKARSTISNFRMFMFDSNHSSLHIPMHCKIKKSSQSSFWKHYKNDITKCFTWIFNIED